MHGFSDVMGNFESVVVLDGVHKPSTFSHQDHTAATTSTTTPSCIPLTDKAFATTASPAGATAPRTATATASGTGENYKKRSEGTNRERTTIDSKHTVLAIVETDAVHTTATHNGKVNNDNNNDSNLIPQPYPPQCLAQQRERSSFKC